MDLNCLMWVVSLVVAKQKQLASSLMRHIRFYELRSAMEPPHFVKRLSKVVGGKWASIAHLWDLWDVGRIFAYDKADEEMEYHGQHSKLVHPKMDLEEHVQKMFFEECTAHQMEEVW